MKHLVSAVLLGVALATPAFALDCTSTVVDDAHAFKVPIDTRTLSQKGVEVYIRTNSMPVKADAYRDLLKLGCPAWTTRSSDLRGNVVLFVLLPSAHQTGVYYGSEFKAAIDPALSVIQTQFMVPAFKVQDYSRGMQQGVNQTANAVERFQTGLTHPSTTVVTHQATDLHGLWIVLGWCLGLAALGGLVWIFVLWRRERDATQAAQQEAINARTQVLKQLNTVDDGLKTKEALNVDVSEARGRYNAAMEDYANIAESAAFDPADKRFSKEQYQSIKARYLEILHDLLPAAGRQQGNSWSGVSGTQRNTASSANFHSSIHHSASPVMNQNVTVYNSPGVLVEEPAFIPVIVPEPVYQEPIYRPAYSEPVTQDDGGSGGSYDDSSSDDDGGSAASYDDSSSGGDDGGGGGDSF